MGSAKGFGDVPETEAFSDSGGGKMKEFTLGKIRGESPPPPKNPIVS